jgi:erythronate-4-phosphate dehydrogenase
LANIADEKNFHLADKTIGVVGYGNIGTRIVRLAEALGMKALKNDPPLEREGRISGFVPLDEILNCDIITFHVPLNMEGDDKTYHLMAAEQLNRIKDDAIIINASRGPVVDNAALLNYINQKGITAVLDVWENEPEVNVELLKKVKFGTPHIAGYSLEGKVNGTQMMYNALCSFLDIEPAWKPQMSVPPKALIEIDGNDEMQKEFLKAVNHVYDVRNDDETMRELEHQNDPAAYFDSLRKNYPYRREFLNYEIAIEPFMEEMAYKFRSFRFIVNQEA